MEDGRWVTLKNGRRVFIKTTNSYMNDMIRGKGKKENNETDKSAVGTYEVYKNGIKCNIEVRQFNNGKSKMYAVDNPFKGFEWGTNFYKTEDAVKRFLSKHNATKKEVIK